MPCSRSVPQTHCRVVSCRCTILGKDEDWQINEFILPEDFASTLPQIAQIFMYHSRNDEEVPFAHLWHYQAKLPQATARAFDGNAHSFKHGLPILVDDKKRMNGD